MATIWPAVMCGSATDAVRISDSVISSAITPPAKALVHRPLTHGPRTALSLHSSSKNTVALGSSTPARTWTPSVNSPAASRE